MTAYGYDSFRSILLAMEKANSVEVADVIRTLETSTWEGILGKMSINASHQTVRPYYVIRCKAQKEMRNDADFAEIVAQSVTPQPAQFNECKAMPGI
jgi:branched-chain amino acid transport system substrate-binding protein